MPGEGRGLSSRQTQDVVRDLEIGQPSNSEKCSETADGVTRESEGGSRLSLLRPVRQDQPRGHSGACLCPVPLQQGRTGRGRPGLCGHRNAWGRAVLWHTASRRRQVGGAGKRGWTGARPISVRRRRIRIVHIARHVGGAPSAAGADSPCRCLMVGAAVSPRDVLIPLYGGSIARVRCGGVPPASHPAKLIPEIAHLLDNGLYGAGSKALGAAALIRSKTQCRHLWQWLTRRRPPGVLWVVNSTEIAGLSPENAASAELGLAIVQLMLVNSSRESRVIATGMLASLKATPASHFDLPVEPVSGIGEKFEAIIGAFRGRNDLPPAPTLFLVPEYLPSGELVTEVYHAKIARLRSELGIAVRPVATLGDAMRAVGAGHPSTTLADRAALAALGVAAASVVLAGAAWWVPATPVDVRFVPVPFPGINQS